jgi:Ni/Fe-hydrogenase subunit HybB-like protein
VSSAVLESANPRALPRALVAVCALLIAVGVGAFLAGLAMDAETAWRAYHVNFIYFAGLSQGGLVLACAMVIIGAQWPGPVRHVAAALAAWVPITFVLACLSFFGREAIYTEWIHGPPHGKEAWLNIPRLYITDLAILGVLALLSQRFLKASLRPALHGAAQRARVAKGLFERWAADWRGDEAERADSERQLRRLAPIICLVYAFGYTVIAYDQVMSLSPTWFSNIFGWYFGWGGFLSGVAATALISVLLRSSPGWEAEITKPRMHDLGKMVFAFSIFWMYLFFSQYIVIWYGNLPEETQFLRARLGSQFLQDTWFFVLSRLNEPYVNLSMAAWVGCWIIPFVLLMGQRPKRSPAMLGTVAALVLLGFWFERNALVWPSLVPEQGWAWLGPIQIGIAAGFLGAFALVYLVFSRVFPTLPLPRR